MKKNSSRQVPTKMPQGFTLVELMVVMAIMSILVFAVASMAGGISNGKSASQVSYEVKAVLEQARTVAMSQNTYVWVGFAEETDAQGNTGLELMAVKGQTGQSTDLANGLVTPMMSPTNFSNIMLSSNLSITGMATGSNVVDVSNSTVGSFTACVAGNTQAFTQIIQFSPQSEAQAQSTTLVPWITMGFAPVHGKATNIAGLQVAGSTSEVSVF